MDGSATGDAAFFHNAFSDLPDPRTGPNIIHKLHDSIVLAICGILCGADSWVEIESSLHWVLDMTFREDERRIRKDHGTENFSRLCRIALNQLKKETSKKRRSLRVKRKLAGWSNDYLMKLLTL